MISDFKRQLVISRRRVSQVIRISLVIGSETAPKRILAVSSRTSSSPFFSTSGVSQAREITIQSRQGRSSYVIQIWICNIVSPISRSRLEEQSVSYAGQSSIHILNRSPCAREVKVNFFFPLQEKVRIQYQYSNSKYREYDSCQQSKESHDSERNWLSSRLLPITQEECDEFHFAPQLVYVVGVLVN